MNDLVKSRLTSGSIIVIIFFLSLFSIYLVRSPEVTPGDVPLTEFSTSRAMTHIRTICNKPHSIGTYEHKRVQDYLINELKKLGLNTETQKTTTNYFYRKKRLLSANVFNIIGTLKGKEDGKKVFIVGHYDSQPHTPGAADDGLAVASMLETVRALKESPQLKNDVVFLFTDAEENGLLGAHAFMNKHPLAKKIGILFNFESRGNSGPIFMFEVSPGNGWIMREFYKSIPQPYAASVMYEVYKLLVNNTDFTVFKNGGISGFNAATIDGFANYHNMTDNFDNLDQGSLQHAGSYMINFARHFGNINIENTKAKDIVFFNTIGSSSVFFSKATLYVFGIITIILFLGYLFLGLKEERLTLMGIARSVGINIAAIAVVCGIIFVLQKIIKMVYPHYTHFYGGNFYNVKYYIVMISALVLALFLAINFFIFHKTKDENYIFGPMLTAILIMIGLLLGLPTASYLFMVPLFFLIIGHIVCFKYNISEKNSTTLFGIIHFASFVPSIFIMIPIVHLLYIIFALEISMAGALFLLIFLGLMMPQFMLLDKIGKKVLFIGSLLIVLTAFMGGHITSGYSEEQPLKSNVAYCMNADTGKAIWFSRFLDVDEWNKQFFKKSREFSITEGPLKSLHLSDRRNIDKVRLVNDAPGIKLPLPRFQLLDDKIDNGLRKIDFTIETQRKAQKMKLAIPISIDLKKLTINGDLIGDENYYDKEKKEFHVIYFVGFTEKKIKIQLECTIKNTFDVFVIESKLGLPDLKNIKPMPKKIVPDSDGESYITMQFKKYTI